MNQVRQVLDHYPADCQPSQIESLGSAGGMSGAQFWRWESPRGKLVLRRWPIEHPTRDGLRFIHAVLRHAYEGGLNFVPLPIPARDVATFVKHAGHLWELAPWLPGVADYEQNPRVEKLRAATKALAQFHLATADVCPTPPLASSRGFSPAIIGRLTRLRELQNSGIDALARSISDNTWPELVPLARQFLAALPRSLPPAIAQLTPLSGVELPLQPAIRDIWHDHVLFDGDRVTGLIDFGALEIETPASDVARLLGSFAGISAVGGVSDADFASDHLVHNESETWRKGLAAYSAVRPLTDQETAAVFALDASGTILAGCNWIRWIFVDGRQFENHSQVIARFMCLLGRVRDIDAHPH